MMCLNREGKSKCTWWITECVNPSVSAKIKKVCNGQIPRYETQDIGLKFHSYPPPVQETSLGTSKSDNDNYLRRGTE